MWQLNFHNKERSGGRIWAPRSIPMSTGIFIAVCEEVCVFGSTGCPPAPLFLPERLSTVFGFTTTVWSLPGAFSVPLWPLEELFLILMPGEIWLFWVAIFWLPFKLPCLLVRPSDFSSDATLRGAAMTWAGANVTEGSVSSSAVEDGVTTKIQSKINEKLHNSGQCNNVERLPT